MHTSRSDYPYWPIVGAVLESARGSAVLLGLVNEKLLERPYAKQSMLDMEYAIAKTELPNKFARLDVLFVDGEPAGTVLWVEIAKNVQHMVGMYVLEHYQSATIYKRFETLGASPDVLAALTTPARLLFENSTKAMIENNRQATLEVMNYNEKAYKLYEKNIDCGDGGGQRSFELSSRSEITHYAKIRHKKIGSWHHLAGRHDIYGVQRQHVPNYNDVPTWSISRVYNCKGDGEALFSGNGGFAYLNNRGKLLWSVIRSGRFIGFIRYLLLRSRFEVR